MVSALSRVIFGDARHMDRVGNHEAQLTFLSPPYVGHKTRQEHVAEAELLRELFAESVRVTVPDGIIATYNTDFRLNGTMYERHDAVRDAAEANGLELFVHKIRVRTYKTDLYRLGYSHVLGFRQRGIRPRVNRQLPEYRPDVWYLPASQRIGDFRDAIPPEPPAIFIANFTDPDDLVVAPCAGSGTAVLAALGLGRRATGYEIDPGRKQTIQERERRFLEYFSDERVRLWFTDPTTQPK